MDRSISLKSLLAVFKKNLVFILLSSVIFAIGGVVFAKTMVTPLYGSSIEIFVNNKITDQNIISSSDINSSQQLTSTYIVFMKNDEVLSKVAESMGGKYSVTKIRSMLTFSQISNAMFVKIVAKTPSADDSSKICTLVAENAKKVIEDVTKVENMEIVGTANTTTSPVSPNVGLYAVLGFLIGLVGSFVIFYILAYKDTTIKDKESVLEIINAPFFGEIPSFNTVGRGKYGYGYGNYGYSYGYGYGDKSEKSKRSKENNA